MSIGIFAMLKGSSMPAGAYLSSRHRSKRRARSATYRKPTARGNLQHVADTLCTGVAPCILQGPHPVSGRSISMRLRSEGTAAGCAGPYGRGEVVFAEAHVTGEPLVWILLSERQRLALGLITRGRDRAAIARDIVKHPDRVFAHTTKGNFVRLGSSWTMDSFPVRLSLCLGPAGETP